MTPAPPDLVGLIREAQGDHRPIRLVEARARLGSSWREYDLARETVLMQDNDVLLPPATWLNLLHQALARQQATASPVDPDLLALLPEPSLVDLIRLLRRIERRRESTSLEQVAREVGSRAYAEILAEVWDRPVVIRRGRIVSLSAGTYSHRPARHHRSPPRRRDDGRHGAGG